MNRFYDSADAIIIKPGGVTISECLFKKIPIFIYYELPGQEEINLKNLKEWGLVYHLDNWKETSNFEEKKLNNQLECYHQNLCNENFSVVINQVLGIGK